MMPLYVLVMADVAVRTGDGPDAAERAGDDPYAAVRACDGPDAIVRAGGRPDAVVRAGDGPDAIIRAGDGPDAVLVHAGDGPDAVVRRIPHCRSAARESSFFVRLSALLRSLFLYPSFVRFLAFSGQKLTVLPN